MKKHHAVHMADPMHFLKLPGISQHPFPIVIPPLFKDYYIGKNNGCP
jgi:hypothetical protein